MAPSSLLSTVARQSTRSAGLSRPSGSAFVSRRPSVASGLHSSSCASSLRRLHRGSPSWLWPGSHLASPAPSPSGLLPGSSLRLVHPGSSCLLPGSSLRRLHPGLCLPSFSRVSILHPNLLLSPPGGGRLSQPLDCLSVFSSPCDLCDPVSVSC